MNPTFFGLKQAEALGCSVSIVNVDPPSGTIIEDNNISPTTGTISVNVTVSWSVNIPFENITGTGFLVLLNKAFWNETKSDWQFLGANTIAFGKSDITNVPKTVRLGLDPKKMWLLNASVTCEYIKNQTNSFALPELGYYSNYDEKILNYQIKSDLPLQASFTMNPENPTINDNIAYLSTSTSPNSKIVESKWYLDGQYLQDVGNKSAWSNKLSKGTHTVSLTVTDNYNNSDTASRTFEVKDTIVTNLAFTATTSKTTYITREKIIINGSLTYAGAPVMGADINLKILQADGTLKTWPGPLTAVDGLYKVEYEVPRLPLKSIPSNTETWVIEVTADPVEAEYSAISTSVTVQIVPVYLQLHSIHPVQIAESPVIDGKTYVAAGREAGLRVMVSCPSLKGFAAISHPEVTVAVDIGFGNTNVKHDIQTASIGPDPTPVDFTFNLTSGTYIINAIVDPYNDFMDTSYTQQLQMSKTTTAKEMKILRIEYVPIYLQLMNKTDLLSFNSFCEQQSSFIRAVYPIPDSKLKFYAVTETISPILLSPTLALQRWLLLKALSLRSYLTADKVVGVLPADTGWWGPGEDGYSGWSFPPFSYYTRSILVKNGSNEGVTAHEIGHTLGLNRYPSNEEYTTNPFFGIEVKGLILKQGKIFNVTNENEKVQAFGAGTSRVFCFMGNNPGYPLPSWVCNKTYSELFKYLMDPPGRIVYVAGSIYKNDTVQLDSWYLGEGEPDPVDEGTYTMQCVSSTGDILYSTNFGEEPEDFLGFGFVIPYPEGTATVLIKKADQVLREVRASLNAPVVNVQFPNGGETIDGASVVSWSGNDYDGDQLLYSVLCSSDYGDTWSALVLELNETSYSVDFSTFPNANQYMIKVVASDGFNTGQDVSNSAFTVTHSSVDDNSDEGSPTSFSYILIGISLIVAAVVLSFFVVFTLKKRNKNTLPPPPPIQVLQSTR